MRACVQCPQGPTSAWTQDVRALQRLFKEQALRLELQCLPQLTKGGSVCQQYTVKALPALLIAAGLHIDASSRWSLFTASCLSLEMTWQLATLRSASACMVAALQGTLTSQHIKRTSAQPCCTGRAAPHSARASRAAPAAHGAARRRPAGPRGRRPRPRLPRRPCRARRPARRRRRRAAASAAGRRRPGAASRARRPSRRRAAPRRPQRQHPGRALGLRPARCRTAGRPGPVRGTAVSHAGAPSVQQLLYGAAVQRQASRRSGPGAAQACQLAWQPPGRQQAHCQKRAHLRSRLVAGRAGWLSQLALPLGVLRDARAHELEHALDRARLAQRDRLALGPGHHKAQAPEDARVERAPVVELLRQPVRAAAAQRDLSLCLGCLSRPFCGSRLAQGRLVGIVPLRLCQYSCTACAWQSLVFG